jgi:hypothetical protein
MFVQLSKTLQSKTKIYGYKIARKIFFPSYSIEEFFPKAEKLYPIPPETVATPEVKQMNVVKLSKPLQTDNYSIPDIYTVHLNQVIYYPRYDLILPKFGKVLKETNYITIYALKPIQMFSLIKKVNRKVAHLFNCVSKPEQISGVCSVIRRSECSKHNHYHALIDVIPRLYLLNQPEYQNINEIKLLFPSEPTTIESFFINKLAPKNLKITVVDNPDNLYLIDELIFPTFMSRLGSGYLPSVYLNFFRDKVLPKRKSKKSNKIFISRAKARHRRLINENELFEALEPYGFKKYFLEDLSIQAEIELFYDADYVVGVLGAGLTNIIFSSQIKVLEIFNSEFCATDYYYLAKSLGHTYGYCHGSHKKAKGKADFRVNVSEVVERLLELEKQHQH